MTARTGISGTSITRHGNHATRLPNNRLEWRGVAPARGRHVHERRVRKQLDGPQGMVFPFDAPEVPMGNDSYGEPLTSRIIDWNAERNEPKRGPRKRRDANG